MYKYLCSTILGKQKGWEPLLWKLLQCLLKWILLLGNYLRCVSIHIDKKTYSPMFTPLFKIVKFWKKLQSLWADKWINKSQYIPIMNSTLFSNKKDWILIHGTVRMNLKIHRLNKIEWIPPALSFTYFTYRFVLHPLESKLAGELRATREFSEINNICNRSNLLIV